MSTRRWTTCAMLLVGTLLVLGGCADKLTRNHYEMIVVDTSTTDDVARTIGEPNRPKLPGIWVYERVDKHLVVKIEFNDAAVVVRKEWIDAMAEEWDDTGDPGDTDNYESTDVRKLEE